MTSISLVLTYLSSAPSSYPSKAVHSTTFYERLEAAWFVQGDLLETCEDPEDAALLCESDHADVHVKKWRQTALEELAHQLSDETLRRYAL